MFTIALAMPRRAARLQSKGFTFLEMMVVVGIISAIVSIVTPNYGYVWQKTQVANSMTTLQRVALAMELYYSNYQTYPPDLGGGAVTPALFGGGTQYLGTTPTDARGGSIVYWTNGYGIPAGTYNIGTTTTWDGSVLQGSMNANLTSSPPAAGSKYRIMLSSCCGVFANGPM